MLALAFLRSLRGAGPDGTPAVLMRWVDVVAAVLAAPAGQQRIVVSWSYLLAVAELPAERLGDLVGAAGREAKESLMSAANKLRAEGRVEILLRLITRRFGDPSPEVAARIRAGTSADLDRWADAVLTASSLAAMLDA